MKHFPATTTPANSFPVPIKVLQHYVPLYADEISSIQANIAKLSKAVKVEAELREKCVLKCKDPKAFKKPAMIYMRSKACLQAQMLEANKRLPFFKRLSPAQIIERSYAYNITKKLDEPVKVRKELKSNGTGFRDIMDFGLVARGAQRMARELLGLTYTHADFQYTSRGVPQAVKEALRLINEEGYRYVAEVDICNHYGSFDFLMLSQSLPFDTGVTREVICAASAIPHGPGAKPSIFPPFPSTCPGIPQGSTSSNEVASWSVAHLKMFRTNLTIKNLVVLNYADNFFLLTKSQVTLDVALKALRLAIAKLPGGSFTSKTVQQGSVTHSFRMLGAWITWEKGKAVPYLTETALQRHSEAFDKKFAFAEVRLSWAKQNGFATPRLEGVQAFLRLQSYLEGWANAYAFCEDTAIVIEDGRFELDRLRERYTITAQEMKDAMDRWTQVRFELNSG